MRFAREEQAERPCRVASCYPKITLEDEWMKAGWLWLGRGEFALPR